MSAKITRRNFAKGLSATALLASAGCASEQPETEQPAASGSAQDFKIIDPHVHVWKNDPQYPWPADLKNPPEEDALPETLLGLMDANGVAHTVIVHVIHYRWDCRYAGDVIKQYPDKFQGVCRVNPEAPDAADELTKWTKEYGYHGVRLSPSVNESGDWIKNDSLMDPIWKRAVELKVPMCILTRTQRLPDVARLIDRYPDLDVVIDHMADCPPDQPDELAKLLDLARFPRVFVKISHTWSISKEEYPYRDTWDQVKKLYASFGPERLMWGTDWPLVERHCGYAKALALVRDEMDFLNDEDKRWILGKSIERVWPFSA